MTTANILKYVTSVGLMVCMVTLAGCGQPSTPLASATPLPTATLTLTPQPTSTPQDTATPTPVPPTFTPTSPDTKGMR